jgi:hypothetical protein
MAQCLAVLGKTVDKSIVRAEHDAKALVRWARWNCLSSLVPSLTVLRLIYGGADGVHAVGGPNVIRMRPPIA